MHDESFDIFQYIRKLHKVLDCLLQMSSLPEDEYHLNDKFYFSRPKYAGDIDTRVEFRVQIDEKFTDAMHIVQVVLKGAENPIWSIRPFFNDDYYSLFMHFNPDTIQLDTSAMRDLQRESERHECPSIDLTQEEGRFQYQMMLPTLEVNALTIYQYFYRLNYNPFSTWFHSDFDELYEVLDERFNFGEEA